MIVGRAATAVVTASGSPELLVLWTALWLQSALEDHLPDITGDVAWTSALLGVAEGTGVEQLTGGRVSP